MWVGLIAAPGARVQAQAEPRAGAKPETTSTLVEIPGDQDVATLRPAIDRGLEFLRRSQLGSGAIGGRYTVAVTSLGGLAVLGAGYRYREGPYSGVLELALRFLKQSARADGYISDGESRMHGHAYAVLFLTQLYGELPAAEQTRVEGMIRAGLEVIRRSQSRDGGWYYTPENPERADEASITICALQALRAANGSGFVVPKSTVDHAVDYVKKCQAPDGSFMYSYSGSDHHTSFALTVAALSTLHSAGVYDAPEVSRGLDFARRRIAERPGDPIKAAEKEFFAYANLYAAQAFYQAGGDLWAIWYQPARRHLLKRQLNDGSWSDDYGPEFGTATSVLVLEVPLNYLPIFQR